MAASATSPTGSNGGGSSRARSYSAARRVSALRGGAIHQKRQACVLDIGESLTKCGFAGEPRPRAIFPTVFQLRDGTELRGALSRGQQRRLDLADWTDVATALLRYVFLEELQVAPRERRIVLVENPFMPFLLKQALVDVLLAMEAEGVLFLAAQHVPAFASDVRNGLVVDVGFGETRVLPVQERYAATDAFATAMVGMRDAYDFLRELQAADSKTPERDAALLADDDAVEEIVARHVRVRAAADGDEADEKAVRADVTVQVDNTHAVTVSGRARHLAADALFGENEEGLSVARVVLDALLKCGIDARVAVIEGTLVPAGGATMLPGFMSRLVAEVNALLGSDARYASLRKLKNKIKLHDPSFPPLIVAWTGASMVAALDIREEAFVTKKSRDEDARTGVVVERKQPGGGGDTVKTRVRDPIMSVIPDWTMFQPPQGDEDDYDEDDEQKTF